MSNELCHHGVKGMKWGVRKAQKKQARIEKKAKIKEQRANETPEERSQRIKNNVKKGAKITAAVVGGLGGGLSGMYAGNYLTRYSGNSLVQGGAAITAGMLGSYLGTKSVAELVKL